GISSLPFTTHHKAEEPLSASNQMRLKMTQILITIFSMITLISTIVLTIMSASPYQETTLLFSILLLGFGAFVISLTWATWSNKNWQSTFINSLKVSFGLSSLTFILGYLYTALQPIILK